MFVGIGIGVLLRGVLDVDDLPLWDELLQEQGEQPFAAGEFLKGALEPIVEQDVGIDALGFVGDVVDAGRFEVGVFAVVRDVIIVFHRAYRFSTKMREVGNNSNTSL